VWVLYEWAHLAARDSLALDWDEGGQRAARGGAVGAVARAEERLGARAELDVQLAVPLGVGVRDHVIRGLQPAPPAYLRELRDLGQQPLEVLGLEMHLHVDLHGPAAPRRSARALPPLAREAGGAGRTRSGVPALDTKSCLLLPSAALACTCSTSVSQCAPAARGRAVSRTRSSTSSWISLASSCGSARPPGCLRATGCAPAGSTALIGRSALSFSSWMFSRSESLTPAPGPASPIFRARDRCAPASAQSGPGDPSARR
jgi:hypothetical protein